MSSPAPSAPPSHPVALESTLLRKAGFCHGFFTRCGGASEAPFASLNFSVSVGDDPVAVERNFGVAGQHLGVLPQHIYFLSQVHGNDCVTLEGTEDQTEVWQQKGDAVCGLLPTPSTSPGAAYAIGVRTADCVPVLIGCTESGLVAAVHAGWRGCVAGVVGNALECLRSAGGQRFVAAIGPHISQQAFEVSSEVADELQAASPARDIVDRSRAKPHVDLRKMVEAQLVQAGVARGQVDHVMGCTLTQPELFYSYRRDGKVSGRHLSAIVPRPLE